MKKKNISLYLSFKKNINEYRIHKYNNFNNKILTNEKRIMINFIKLIFMYVIFYKIFSSLFLKSQRKI